MGPTPGGCGGGAAGVCCRAASKSKSSTAFTRSSPACGGGCRQAGLRVHNPEMPHCRVLRPTTPPHVLLAGARIRQTHPTPLSWDKRHMERNVSAAPTWVVGRGLGLSLSGSEVEILDGLDAVLLLLRCGGETEGGGQNKNKLPKKTLKKRCGISLLEGACSSKPPDTLTFHDKNTAISLQTRIMQLREILNRSNQKRQS